MEVHFGTDFQATEGFGGQVRGDDRVGAVAAGIEADGHPKKRAPVFGLLHPAGQQVFVRLAGGAKRHVLRPNGQGRRFARRVADRPVFPAHPNHPIPDPVDARLLADRVADEVHGADEVRHERVGRLVVDFVGRSVLDQLAPIHHQDAVGHGEGLLLVVGHHHGGEPQPLLKGADFPPQPDSHPGVQGGQRLVQQEEVRGRRDGPGQGHPLLLAAGKLRRKLPSRLRHSHQLQQFLDPGVDLRPAAAPAAQPVGHVGGGGQVGKQGVGLKHDAHVPPGDGKAGHVPVLNANLAAVLQFQPGDHPEQGGFSAAAGAEHGNEGPPGGGKGDVPKRGEVSELFGHARDRQVRGLGRGGGIDHGDLRRNVIWARSCRRTGGPILPESGRDSRRPIQNRFR